MSENKKYQKSQMLWLELQEIIICQLKLQKENAEQTIILNKQVLKNANQSLKHEVKMLEEFLRINNLNPKHNE